MPGAAIRTRAANGSSRTTRRRWLRPPSRRCAATSTTPRSSTRASPPRFFKRGDKFIVRTDGPDGKLADFEVSYTFGVAPLQQYLIALPGGRLQPLQIAWDSERRRWFHLLPHEKAPPGDVLHWTGRYQTANTMCIGLPHHRLREALRRRRRHLRLALERTQRVVPVVPRPRANGMCSGRSVASRARPRRTWPASATACRSTCRRRAARSRSRSCAPCHSRRSELTASYVPGQPRLDHFLPSLLTPAAVPRRRPATRRGVCRRLVPAEQDVPEGRGLH